MSADLIASIRDLHAAIVALTDELRQRRQIEQASIEVITELHQQPASGDVVHSEQGELYG